MTAERREATEHLLDQGLSKTKACKITGIGRATFYRQPTDWRQRDAAVINALNEHIAKSPQAGFWKCYKRLRQAGYLFNHKRVYRVYCRMGLNQPRRTKRALPKRTPKPLELLPQSNRQWALDFIHDSLYCSKTFRTLNIIDEGTRECLAIEIDSSLPVTRVVRVLNRLKEERGVPSQIRMDNGPEFISSTFINWYEENEVEMVYIKPGKPLQNGFAERFNGSFRREFLAIYLFETLSQVRDMAWVWMIDYNEERPHDSLGGLPPAVYRQL